MGIIDLSGQQTDEKGKNDKSTKGAELGQQWRKRNAHCCLHLQQVFRKAIRQNSLH
jgi:hypothetical protein